MKNGEPEKTPSISTLSKLSFQDVESTEGSGDGETKTEWKAVVIAAVVTFIAAVENTVLGMSEWAYMNEIDKVADAEFFGYATAASKAFHAIAALAFAVWCYKSESFRLPLIAGRLIAFFACILYLCVEFVTDGRRYVMLLCYIFFGIASSSSSILRAYVAAISSSHDRPQAYSTITAATMLSIIVGPLIQAVFTGIAYPGFQIFPNVRFHLYSAPVWVAASTNFISIAIIFFCLKELPKKAKNVLKKDESMMTLEGFRKRVLKVSSMNLDWPTIVICWIMKMLTTISVVTLTTLTSIFLITNYGWARQSTVLAISLCMGTVGILSITISLLYFFCNLGKIVPQQSAFLIGTIIFVSMYVFAYPWPSFSSYVAPYNATVDIGCNPERYSWCDYSMAPSPIFLLVVIAIVMGIGIPLALVALDAIYSKCLGEINQSVMQGAIIVAEDVVLILGPIYTSWVFTDYGFGTLWFLNGIIVSVGALIWLFNMKKLSKYS